MKTIAYIIVCLFCAAAKAADWVDISEDRLRKTAEKSKVVFVLHWSEPANDYVMEVIKGFPELKRFIPALTSWRTFTERIYADPFATPTKPNLAIVMMEDPDPNSEYYGGYTMIAVSHKEKYGDFISADAALELLRKYKTEPNQTPQTTTRTVTDRAPSSTLRASASRA
jgi:hypothetical protein